MVDEDAVTELSLFLDNDGDIYRQRIKPMYANLRKKVTKGIYKRELAVKLFMYAVDVAAKKYAKEFASPSEWNKLFPKDVRKAVAEIAAKSFEAEPEGA